MLTTLVVITVFGVGGPREHQPSVLPNATVKVEHRGRSIAVMKSGNARLHLRPGAYTVSARLLPPAATPGRTCEVRALTVRRQSQPQRLHLFCQLK
jgi:hypothetical protein